MSYTSWHTYGYGVCISDIKECSVEHLENLLKFAPKYRERIHVWLQECGITDPIFDNYVEYDQDFSLGLATILKEVILESENVDLVACDDLDNHEYLLFVASYPWAYGDHAVLQTEKEAEALFRKYTSILADEQIEIGYYAAENGG